MHPQHGVTTRSDPARHGAVRARSAGTGGLRVARIAGIDVTIHQTWFIAFALITWSLAVGYYPSTLPDEGPLTYWILGAASALGLFGSVLVHELSHSLVARARGLRVRGITLFIFGGVSNIEADAERPSDEFVIAVVGPLTSLAIAGVAFLMARIAPASTAVGAVVGYLAVVNVLVGLFNLLPGFPLDGGRVLRAGIWAATRSLSTATRWASYAGQVVGFLMIFLGVTQVFAGNVLGGIWIAFIGWFLSGAAETSRRELELEAGLRGVTVGALMDPTPPIADPEMRVREFLLERVMREGERAVLVVKDGRLEGIVTVTDAKNVAPEAWDRATVGSIMTAAPLRTVHPDGDLSDALRELVRGEFQQLPVVRDGTVVGIVGREDVLRAIVLRNELGIELPRGPRGESTLRPGHRTRDTVP